MFSRSSQRVTKQILQQAQRHYTPSIKFTHGDRAAIEKEMASRSNRQPWMVDHSATSQLGGRSAAPAAFENTTRFEGKPLKHGPLTTKVIHMESTWYGNPFNSKPQVPQQFDDKTIDLINMGGAF